MPIQRRKVNQELTEIQQQVYDYIIKYITENGYAPSYREISIDCKHGMGTVFEAIERLNHKRLIVSRKNSPRAIKVVGYKFVKDEQ